MTLGWHEVNLCEGHDNSVQDVDQQESDSHRKVESAHCTHTFPERVILQDMGLLRDRTLLSDQAGVYTTVFTRSVYSSRLLRALKVFQG